MGTTPDSLLNRFRDHLLKDGYTPGDRLLPETELAEKFGVSRGTIREIIMHLTFSGVVERAPRRGTLLREINLEPLEEDLAFRLAISRFSFEELMETRRCLEVAIVPLIVERITPEAAASLSATIDRMVSLADDPAEADQMDERFHLDLLHICGNRPLRLMSHVIRRVFNRAYRDRFVSTDSVLNSAREHREILSAIRGGDVPRAIALLSAHVGDASRMYREAGDTPE